MLEVLSNADKKVIRMEIENHDEELDESTIKDVIVDMSIFTTELFRKYKIPGERFKIIIGRSMFERFLNL